MSIYLPLLGPAVALLAVVITVLTFRFGGARVKVRAFMFCWRDTSNWKLVIEARNSGRLSGSLHILGVEVTGVRPNHKQYMYRAQLDFEEGPSLPYELKPQSVPVIWIADGKQIYSDASYNWGLEFGDGGARVVVRCSRWRVKRIRVGRAPRSWVVSHYKDRELGWDK